HTPRARGEDSQQRAGVPSPAGRAAGDWRSRASGRGRRWSGRPNAARGVGVRRQAIHADRGAGRRIGRRVDGVGERLDSSRRRAGDQRDPAAAAQDVTDRLTTLNAWNPQRAKTLSLRWTYLPLPRYSASLTSSNHFDPPP